MRLTKARIQPLSDGNLTGDQRELLAPMIQRGRVLNVFRTMVVAPKAARGFLAWGGYILSRRNELSEREREILIMRTGFLCKSGYEWTQHKRISLNAGMTEEEIERIKMGPTATGWTPLEAALLAAADELHHDQFITDKTWSTLRTFFSEKQCMDVVFTVGQYTQVSMFLNSFGVQLDEGQILDPDLKCY